MTIESQGQEYTFEGYLTQTDIQMEQNPFDVGEFDNFRTYLPSHRHYTVDLSIDVVGEIRRTLLPKKGPTNVQR